MYVFVYVTDMISHTGSTYFIQPNNLTLIRAYQKSCEI
jgi:hypothetical protein